MLGLLVGHDRSVDLRESIGDARHVGLEEGRPVPAGARPGPWRGGPRRVGHRRLRLHEERREEQLDRRDIGREAGDGRQADPGRPHRPATSALGDHLEQPRLDVRIRIVDRDPGRAGPFVPGAGRRRQARRVDGVLGHEAVRLRGEGFRLGLVRRRLRLGEERPNLAEDRLVGRLRLEASRPRRRPRRWDEDRDRRQPSEHPVEADRVVEQRGPGHRATTQTLEPPGLRGRSRRAQVHELRPPPGVELLRGVARVARVDRHDAEAGGGRRAGPAHLPVHLERLPPGLPEARELHEERPFDLGGHHAGVALDQVADEHVRSALQPDSSSSGGDVQELADVGGVVLLGAGSFHGTRVRPDRDRVRGPERMS